MFVFSYRPINVFWRLCTCCLVVGMLPAWGAQPKLYRWVDDTGTVHYTDSLPPAQADRGHAELSDQGLVVGTTAPAKKLEDLQREEELKRFREAAEQAKRQQEVADRVLLRSFKSVDDMVMARDGKLAFIDVMVKVTRGNIHRQQDWLSNLRSDAADLERSGKPIPQHLSDSIDKTEKSIRDAYAVIVEREEQKQELYASFASDLKRFRQLKDLPEASQPQRDRGPGVPLTNLVSCSGQKECARLWERASAYVREHASTPIETSAPGLLITAKPKGPDDIGLTLAQIPDKHGSGASLFLDAQCKPTLGGDTTCTTAQAQDIIDGFHNAVMGPEPAD